ncbi:hypothetical protein QBC46DRAFT_388890 [Diplogelasinospora grovesii]|uniref:Uncharacterized protein n=1 Tax=Diplogelasinospora grovesii TaxID=303347 RepID=A0AAN6N562_9PEZI|nr:hypothetical protein QBC46DRAFT_388890 [Diplogelasinospora grovesii]
MQLNVSPVTLAALKADGTIRCLADVKYQPVPASRHSSTAFALARNLAEEFTTALLAQLGHVTATPSNTCKTASAQAQLYAAQLRRNRMLVCFDVFLDHCTPEFRREIDETVARPIHAVTKLGDDNRYQVDRKLPLDARVAREIAWIQEVDKGPRPYFTDDMTPTCYDDGIRVEDNLEDYPCFSPSRRPGHQK